jgi:uncharacterized membrane protein (UPF0127 family)
MCFGAIRPQQSLQPYREFFPMPSTEAPIASRRRAFVSAVPLRLLAVLFAASLMAPAIRSPARAEAPAGRVSVAGPVEPLQIQTATGAHTLMVEVARTPQQRITGLMYRRSMPRNHGMLFTFDTDQVIMMWMKNTYISLDMIFLDRTGVVISVVTDAVPFSEAIISSGGIAAAVIEVNAGVARELGITAGAVVRHRDFSGAHQEKP